MSLVCETSPYAATARRAIDDLGERTDRRLAVQGAGLTMGGEPTFVAIDHEGAGEWQTEPLGEDKRRRAGMLLRRLRSAWAQGAVHQEGVGRQYPGEADPRWSLGCFWRPAGPPVWSEPGLLAADGATGAADLAAARQVLGNLAGHLGLPAQVIRSAREPGVGSKESLLVLPLLRVATAAGVCWGSCQWSLPAPLELLPGAGSAGLRLPLAGLAGPPAGGWAIEADDEPLPAIAEPLPATGVVLGEDSVRVALCLGLRRGILEYFLPPVAATGAWLDLVSRIEVAARQTGLPVRLGGYPPPVDPDLAGFQLTPDPGVLEVNLPFVSSWRHLVRQAETLQAEARACGLVPYRLLPAGRVSGTGGGRHQTLGAAAAQDSLFFRRPDLLRSLVCYFQRHPALSYAFAGLYTGATSQAPRVDEGPAEDLREVELALNRLPATPLEPAELGRRLQYLFTDLTGNSHRSEFCLDKLWPPEHPRSRLGLLELRGFEMQQHCHLDLVVSLLVRALIVWLLERPLAKGFVDWGARLEQRFALPFFLRRDLEEVAADLEAAGLRFDPAWCLPHLEARYPVLGIRSWGGGRLEVRQAREPWAVPGPQRQGQGPARPVDAADQRLQLRLTAAGGRELAVFCNDVQVPLAGAGPEEWIGGLRFRARSLPVLRHPDLEPQPALLFRVVCRADGRVVAASRYQAVPAGEKSAAGREACGGEAGRRGGRHWEDLPGGEILSRPPAWREPSPEVSIVDLRDPRYP